MKKILITLSMLLAVEVWAGGSETKTVFVPNEPEYIIKSNIEFSTESGRLKDVLKMVEYRNVYDINTYTRDGWEIVNVSKSWWDMNTNGRKNSFEEGKEYILKKEIKEKKGWW